MAATDRAPPEPPRPDSDTARLTLAIEMLTKSIDRLDREIATLRSDARSDFSTLRADAHSDFRLVFGAVITTALGLAAMIAKTSHWF